MVVVLSLALVSCSSDDASSQASTLILSQAADEAEALEIVKETCRVHEYNTISKQLLDDFTKAAQLDEQYSDEVGILLYLRFLTTYNGETPADALILSFPMIEQLKATCRIAGIEWSY